MWPVQFDTETEAGKQKPPMYKRRWFWMRFMPGVLTALLIMIGIIMVIRYKHVQAIYFEVGCCSYILTCRHGLLSHESISYLLSMMPVHKQHMRDCLGESGMYCLCLPDMVGRLT